MKASTFAEAPVTTGPESTTKAETGAAALMSCTGTQSCTCGQGGEVAVIRAAFKKGKALAALASKNFPAEGRNGTGAASEKRGTVSTRYAENGILKKEKPESREGENRRLVKEGAANLGRRGGGIPPRCGSYPVMKQNH